MQYAADKRRIPMRPPIAADAATYHPCSIVPPPISIAGVRWRKEHQPPAMYNAGSVFRNPAGDSAGRLIDSIGLKGFSVGGVRVSEKHANFIINLGGASAADVLQVIEHVERTVARETGHRLEREVRLVGQWAAAPARSS